MSEQFRVRQPPLSSQIISGFVHVGCVPVDNLLHEIAHAIVGREAGHGPLWKVTARRIGATPRAKAYES